MTTNDKIEIMKAYLNGMKIQERKVSISDEPWKDVDYEPIWDWYKKEYRIKPEVENKELILMTKRQLAEWLAKGNGQYRYCLFTIFHCTLSATDLSSEEDFVEDEITIRSWGSDKWVKPTLEIYERDCKGKVDD